MLEGSPKETIEAQTGSTNNYTQEDKEIVKERLEDLKDYLDRLNSTIAIVKSYIKESNDIINN